MGITTQVLINIALILIAMIVGFILHKTGRPYNTAIFTAHKLVSLAFIIFTAIILIGYTRNHEISVFFIAMLIAAVLSIIVLLVSGGMMSLDKMHQQMMRVHWISSGGFVVCIAVIFYKVLTN
jgi:hypothetical protein